MKKLKMFVAALLSIVVVLGGAVPTQAAMSTDVNIAINATMMDGVSVTVPTVLPIVFNEDGTNTLPTNWTIENKSSIAGIHLFQLTLNAGESGWKVLASTKDTTQLPVNTKAIKFYAGNAENLKLVNPAGGVENKAGVLLLDESDINIPAGETKVLSFNVERGAFTTTEASAKAFDMELTFEFN